MRTYHGKHRIWIKTIVTAVACLLLVNDIVLADPDGISQKSTLAVPSQLTKEEFKQRATALAAVLMHPAANEALYMQIMADKEILGSNWERYRTNELDFNDTRIRGKIKARVDGLDKFKLIRVTDLFKKTGQFAHVGLSGKYKIGDTSYDYGMPVIYIDALYYNKMNKAALRHEIDELIQWKELRSIIAKAYGIDRRQVNMREWIKANIGESDKRLEGTKYQGLSSLQIAKSIHEASWPLEDLYKLVDIGNDKKIYQLVDYEYIRELYDRYRDEEGKDVNIAAKPDSELIANKIAGIQILFKNSYFLDAETIKKMFKFAPYWVIELKKIIDRHGYLAFAETEHFLQECNINRAAFRKYCINNPRELYLLVDLLRDNKVIRQRFLKLSYTLQKYPGYIETLIGMNYYCFFSGLNEMNDQIFEWFVYNVTSSEFESMHILDNLSVYWINPLEKEDIYKKHNAFISILEYLIRGDRFKSINYAFHDVDIDFTKLFSGNDTEINHELERCEKSVTLWQATHPFKRFTPESYGEYKEYYLALELKKHVIAIFLRMRKIIGLKPDGPVFSRILLKIIAMTAHTNLDTGTSLFNFNVNMLHNMDSEGIAFIISHEIGHNILDNMLPSINEFTKKNTELDPLCEFVCDLFGLAYLESINGSNDVENLITNSDAYKKVKLAEGPQKESPYSRARLKILELAKVLKTDKSPNKWNNFLVLMVNKLNQTNDFEEVKFDNFVETIFKDLYPMKKPKGSPAKFLETVRDNLLEQALSESGFAFKDIVPFREHHPSTVYKEIRILISLSILERVKVDGKNRLRFCTAIKALDAKHVGLLIDTINNIEYKIGRKNKPLDRYEIPDEKEILFVKELVQNVIAIEKTRYLQDILPIATTDDGKYYVVRYNYIKLRDYALKVGLDADAFKRLLDMYVRILRLRLGGEERVELKPSSGIKQPLVSVECYNNLAKTGRPDGIGHVNIEGQDIDKDSTLRIIDMANVAFAVSNIPLRPKDGELDQCDHLITFIQAQFKELTGRDISREEILRPDRLITLPVIKPILFEKLKEYYEITIKQLEQAA